MLPARFEQASFSLAEINNAKFTRPAVSSGMSVGSFPEQRLVIEPKAKTTMTPTKTGHKNYIYVF